MKNRIVWKFFGAFAFLTLIVVFVLNFFVALKLSDNFEQVLVNLIDNAIKHTEESGRIELSISELDQEIHVTVRDTGIGIAKEHLGRVFERFYRADKARSRELGGTGLGLSIAKHIVLAHKGKITIES